MSHSTSVVPKRRKRLLIDRRVQGALIARVLWYSLAVLTTVVVLLIVWRVASTGPARSLGNQLQDLWFHYGPALVATLSMLPLVLYDVLRISHRFAGPAYRLRNEMRRLAQGDAVRPVRFREGDFWQEFADDFNTLLRRVQSLEARAASAAASAGSPNPLGDHVATAGTDAGRTADGQHAVPVDDVSEGELQLAVSTK